jgi:hypothetical protein
MQQTFKFVDITKSEYNFGWVWRLLNCPWREIIILPGQEMEGYSVRAKGGSDLG